MFKKLALRQLTKELLSLKSIALPAEGWVKTVRNALGMTSEQLAKRCGVSKQRILRIEKDELLKKTSLETLERVAEQLGCRLVYVFVPERSLESIIDKQAEKKAQEKLAIISHSMALEDQRVENDEQVKMIKEELLKTNMKAIWE